MRVVEDLERDGLQFLSDLKGFQHREGDPAIRTSLTFALMTSSYGVIDVDMVDSGLFDADDTARRHIQSTPVGPLRVGLDHMPGVRPQMRKTPT